MESVCASGLGACLARVNLGCGLTMFAAVLTGCSPTVGRMTIDTWQRGDVADGLVVLTAGFTFKANVSAGMNAIFFRMPLMHTSAVPNPRAPLITAYQSEMPHAVEIVQIDSDQIEWLYVLKLPSGRYEIPLWEIPASGGEIAGAYPRLVKVGETKGAKAAFGASFDVEGGAVTYIGRILAEEGPVVVASDCSKRDVALARERFGYLSTVKIKSAPLSAQPCLVPGVN